MKISHRELESCAANPRGWVASQGESSPFRRFGYDRALLFAIYRFHRAELRQAGLQHLQRLCTKFKDPDRVQGLLDRYDAYCDWFAGSGTICATQNVRVALPATDLLTLTGEVSRIDLTPDGYRGVLLGKYEADWQSELRTPLLQRALALRVGRPEDEFRIAVQELDGCGLEEVQFSSKKIRLAQSRFRTVERQVRRALPVP